LLGKKSRRKTVRVFVRAAPPRRVRPGEVDVQIDLFRQLLVLGKLLAVVERQGLPQPCGQGLILLGGGLPDGGRPQIGNAAEQQVSRLPIDKRDRPAATVGADPLGCDSILTAGFSHTTWTVACVSW
jgi:hypothetical protein